MSVSPFGVVGSTIRTRSGVRYDLANPRWQDVKLLDIATALSRICRFGGHTARWYSVAEHSLHCMARAEQLGGSREQRLACLMHDATEAYLGDVVKPLKVLLRSIYGPIESNNEGAIATAFGIDFKWNRDFVKRIDRELLLAERNAMVRNPEPWPGEEGVAVIEVDFRYWPPDEACARFLSAYEGLRE